MQRKTIRPSSHNCTYTGSCQTEKDGLFNRVVKYKDLPKETYLTAWLNTGLAQAADPENTAQNLGSEAHSCKRLTSNLARRSVR